MDDLHLEKNTVLFGADPGEGIVAAELVGRFIRLFHRDSRGVRFTDEPFHPFILLESDLLLDGYRGLFRMAALSGDGAFRYRAVFPDWRSCFTARDFLVDRWGKNQSDPTAPFLFFPDPIHQHLLVTGKTLFKGVEFSHLRRLALDIETLCAAGYEFSNPERAEDRIISIAVMDSSGYEEVLSGVDLSEEVMLRRLGEIIRHRDPDVIEGHNLYRFDLEYIRVRAERHGVPLAWGRDASVPRVTRSRFNVAERIVDYPRWDIFGRHIIDTYFLLLFHDVAARNLESYGLKAAAVHFGLALPGRTYLDPSRLGEIARENPELLRLYNLDDVRETLALSRLLSHSTFLQTRMFPYSYQNCLIRGAATKINALLVREYLRQGVAIPRGRGGMAEVAGGYNKVFHTGVMGPIIHCDVASLYPSIMLTYGLQPPGDHLGVFLPLLGELRQLRLHLKKVARSCTDAYRRDYYEAQQQAFKVLINSFYGYLGATPHNFADGTIAAEITRRGREILQTMVRWLEVHGAAPVEVDTDGIYFLPPAAATEPGDGESLVAELSRSLPTGIEVEMAGRYRAMLSYKMKNYALLAHDGHIIIKGSALRSRGMEKYLRRFTEEMVFLLLNHQPHRVEELYEKYRKGVREHLFPIEWMVRTEILSQSPAVYRQKIGQSRRNRSAAYELALQSGREFRAGDQVSYYVTGWGKGVTAYENCRLVSDHDPFHPDENVAHYLDKLRLVMKKFATLLPAERTLFD